MVLRFVPRLEDRGENVNAAGNADASNDRLTLVMARSRTELNRALGILLSGLLLTGILLLTGAALLIRWAVQRGLRPLDAVADEAATIDAGSLAHRFPTSPMPQEVLPICVRLNELLERLEAAFRREQRFTSDIAHELRTPIAELRSLAEVGLMSATSSTRDEELSQYFRDALAIAVQMERLVAALLTLVRSESNLQVVDLQRVELAALVRDAWRPFREEAGERELSVDFQLPAEAFLETDRALLTAVFTNLFSNAVAYTPRLGKIAVRLTRKGDALVLSLSNTNDQLEQQDLAHMLEAFWRKDRARSDSSHSGLGLSVVAVFARLLGMDLTVDLASAELFQITLRHPKVAG